MTRVMSQLNTHNIFSGDEMRIILSPDLKQCVIFEGNSYELVTLTEGDHQCFNHFQRTGTRSSGVEFKVEYDRGELTYIIDTDVQKLCSATVDNIFFYKGV